MSDHVPRRQLALALQVPQDTLDQRTKQGRLTIYNEGFHRPHCAIQEVDAWLAEAAQPNFNPPPCTADIMSGRIRLLTPEQAAAILKVTAPTVRRCAQRHELEAVKIGKHLRFSLRSVQIKQLTGEGCSLTHQQVAHIIGISDMQVDSLVEQGRRLQCLLG